MAVVPIFSDFEAQENRVYIIEINKIRVLIPGLPRRLSGKESACQCRRHRFDPWSRKIPHSMEQLSLCATTIEPVLESPGIATTEAQHPRAHALQQEKPPP